MDRKLNERLIRIHFVDGVQLVDVNDDWERIFRRKNEIIKIESSEWSWDLQTGKISFH